MWPSWCRVISETVWTSALALLLVATWAVPAPAAIEISAGIKGMGGVNVWTKPSSTPAGVSIAFTKTRAGYGTGGGLFAQAAFLKYLAAEFDILLEYDALWEDQDWGGASTRTRANTTNLRLPLLVKGILPLPGLSLSFGIGPEFVIPVSKSASLSVPANVTNVFKFKVRTKTSVMLTMDLGADIDLPLGLFLPVSIRASYNMTQPSKWGDRVANDSAAQIWSLLYQNSWDFRILVGLGYKF